MGLAEHYLLKQAIGSLDVPKHISYATKEERLRSYVLYEWPRNVIPTPDVLSEAGFFAIGKNFNTIFEEENVNYIYREIY